MKAVYPGSFDPVTSGHFDIICRASKLYDHLTVVLAINSAKSPVFTADERVAMLRDCCTELPNVDVEQLQHGLLVEHAVRTGAQVIVKGLRAVSDFEVEFQMALLNRRLQPGVETVFLMTGAEYSYLSSSIVKEIGRLGGEIAGLVPEPVLHLVQTRLAQHVH